ncbi:MAG: YheV family putative metal-binding protein [Pseudomonadales bacterium]|nr:YheV family putative metal-binding protein [Pseudomonadales bacterium]
MNRRFIAGARCPGCGQFDSLFIEPQAPQERVQCIDCDYSNEKPSEPEPDVNSDNAVVLQFKPTTT